jgi:tagatose 1,6-diphosphate aldolase GatY/KbaY
MIVPFATLLKRAGGRRAVGAFTCYDLETAAAVLDTAGSVGVGVVLLVSPAMFSGGGGERFLAALAAFAERSPAEACVQLDHVSDLNLIERALAAGAGAVMADGSRLSFAENVEFVQAAVALARRAGAAVEAELGAIAGNEDEARATGVGGLTDPAEAAAFAQQSGCDCLAVSIGNVHGRYERPPRLDFDRLERLAGIAVPLALHGASGIPPGQVRQAIELGIGKVNVNTELRDAYLAATVELAASVAGGANLLALHEAQRAAVRRVMDEKLALFTQNHDPPSTSD